MAKPASQNDIWKLMDDLCKHLNVSVGGEREELCSKTESHIFKISLRPPASLREASILEVFRAGDLLAYPIQANSETGPWHYMLHAGFDEKHQQLVWHKSGNSKDDSMWKCERYADALKDYTGRKIYLIEIEDYSEDARRMALERASLLKQAGLDPTYHVIFENCEHFATYCRTGKYVSFQLPPLSPSVLTSHFKYFK